MTLSLIGQKLLDLFDQIIIVGLVSNTKRNITLKTLNNLEILTPENIIQQKIIIQYDQKNLEKNDYCRKILNIKKPDLLNAAYIFLNHYKALKNADLSESNYVLILEDDNIIPKDLMKIYNMLCQIPNDYDYINFNATIPFAHIDIQQQINELQRLKNIHSVNDYYSTFIRCANTGCYAISKNYIKIIVQYLERLLINKKINHIDQIVNNANLFITSKKYVTKFPLFCQQYISTSQMNDIIYNAQYKAYNMSINDFMCF